MPARGRVQVSIVGTPAFVAKLQAAGAAGLKASAAGLYAAGNLIMEDAKNRTPVDTGTLRGSGYVTLPETSGSNVTVEVGFGGPAESYAVVQHEDLSLRHPVGEAKFLERAFDDKASEAQALMARVAADNLKRGGGTIVTLGPTTPGGA